MRSIERDQVLPSGENAITSEIANKIGYILQQGGGLIVSVVSLVEKVKT